MRYVLALVGFDLVSYLSPYAVNNNEWSNNNSTTRRDKNDS